MSSSYYQYYQPTAAVPVPNGKQPQQQPLRYGRNPTMYSQLSASPPERAESVTTSGGGLYSSASSNYAGSDYESSASGGANVDLLDYMHDRLSQTYDPMPMDRNLAKQAQMSGELNAKNRELLALQAQARARMAKTRTNFAQGMKAAQETKRDLEWTQKKVNALNRRAAERYPEQYRAAKQRYPAPDDY